jgi:circadian clock protein KaiC
LVRHLEPFEFFDTQALGDRVEFLHLTELLGDRSGGFESAAAEILRESLETKPAVIVIDSSKALHDVLAPDDFRRAIYELASKVAYSNAVLILVGEYAIAETRSEPEFAVADGILQLENDARGPVDRRWLRILKMRGAEVAAGQHSFKISGRGLEVFPRLETMLPRQVPTLNTRASFNVAKLDAAIGGGIPRGDSTHLIGPSGVGKTLLALRFIVAGLEQQERCLHISFQETEDQVREKVESAGWDWSDVAERQLIIRHIPPVEMDLDEVGALIPMSLQTGTSSASSSTVSPSLRSPHARPNDFPLTSGRWAASSALREGRPSSPTRWQHSDRVPIWAACPSSSTTSSSCVTSSSSPSSSAASTC